MDLPDSDLRTQNKKLVDRAQELNIKNRDLEQEIGKSRQHIKVLETLLGFACLIIPGLIFVLVLLRLSKTNPP